MEAIIPHFTFQFILLIKSLMFYYKPAQGVIILANS